MYGPIYVCNMTKKHCKKKKCFLYAAGIKGLQSGTVVKASLSDAKGHKSSHIHFDYIAQDYKFVSEGIIICATFNTIYPQTLERKLPQNTSLMGKDWDKILTSSKPTRLWPNFQTHVVQLSNCLEAYFKEIV